ncbi:protein SPT2 homolog [Protopterus annectens]|uniref:protein SPT2 homolog n=1 Tax=Protopterus annectens TaxID=7888 RepID=UPI001CFC4174|nr:protein SPT2 homolog [Protopterus annectens]
MDFSKILSIASANQGLSAIPKRYSLTVGPPKKDPKVKGVQSDAVKAFLRRKEEEEKRKALGEKRKKEELLAKRVELKHDKKARAMASRTKDNFQGYNGIPIEENPPKRKRRTKAEMEEERRRMRMERESQVTDEEGYNNYQIDSEEEEEQEEQEDKEQEEQEESISEPASEPEPESESDSESEPEPEPVREPEKPALKKTPQSKPMNFMDLLKLAEKKQFEPVELKTVKRAEDRPRTAEELRELEYLERRKKLEKDTSHLKNSNSVKESKHVKPVRNSEEKQTSAKTNSSSSSVSDKKSKHLPTTQKPSGSPSIKSSESFKTKVEQGGSVKHSLNAKSEKSQIEKVRINEVGKKSEASPVPARSKVAVSSGIQKAVATKDINQRKTVSSSPFSKTNTGSSSGSGASSSLHRTGPSGHVSKSGVANSVNFSKSGGSLHPRSEKNIPVRPGSNALGHDHHENTTKSKSGIGAVTKSDSSIRSGHGQQKPAKMVSGHSGHSAHSMQGSGPVRPESHTKSKSDSSLPGRQGGSAPPRSGNTVMSAPARSDNNAKLKSGNPFPIRPGSNTSIRPESTAKSGPGQHLNHSKLKPGSSASGHPKTGAPARPGSTVTSGPGRPNNLTSKPKCTVVSETISSKNFVAKPNSGSMSGMRAPPAGHRPMMRPPVPSMPPININYKRRIDEEDEYDSEMDDFIDDEGEPQEEISRHIREIFGYDRNRYKDESDYALKYMETSFREQQKEEARSLRLGILEDQEEIRREEEELKRKAMKAKKRKL